MPLSAPPYSPSTGPLSLPVSSTGLAGCSGLLAPTSRPYQATPAFTAGLWTKTALDSINGKAEDRAAFLQAMRTVQIKAPRGPLKLDAYDNPIQNVYISRIQKIKHPVMGEVMVNVPIKTYPAVSQFWTWTPEEFMKMGPYKR